MKINKEGYASIAIVAILLAGLILGAVYTCGVLSIILWVLSLGMLVIFGLVLWFFRMPKRTFLQDENKIVCPSDGKVVVIEEVEEIEYFKDKRIQISIFMSPLNVHCQWYPINGEVTYTKYHKGKYLVAWHPKSSTLNERSTIVIKNKEGQEILVRQIAGAVARRIVTYSKEGDKCEQSQEFGFIKFGSRIDLFLPIGTKLDVNIDDLVTGGVSSIGQL